METESSTDFYTEYDSYGFPVHDLMEYNVIYKTKIIEKNDISHLELMLDIIKFANWKQGFVMYHVCCSVIMSHQKEKYTSYKPKMQKQHHLQAYNMNQRWQANKVRMRNL